MEVSMETDLGQLEVGRRTKSKLPRRRDIDLVRIVLSWSILLYHTVLVYTPSLPYYVKIYPSPPLNPLYSVLWQYSTLWFIVSMNSWNIPVFFFLSGVSAFYSLKVRSEREFRSERLTSLVVPGLWLCLTAPPCLSLDYFSLLTPNCQHFRDGTNIRNQIRLC